MKNRSVWATSLFYVGMLAFSGLAYRLILDQGAQYHAIKETIEVVDKADGQFNLILHVLLALSVVMAMAKICGVLLSFLKQPPVIGEVLGGILLGPSFLGHLAPEFANYLIPANVVPFLGVIAQIGIILYMFLVGLELDLVGIKKSGHSTLAISHASIVIPFILGSWFALYIFDDLAPAGIDFTSFSLFLGVAMAITAFPVLARILKDKGLQKTQIGTLALTCAAVDDVTAWCLLAFVTSIVQSKMTSAFVTLGMTILYIAFMFIVAKPLIRKAVLYAEKFEVIGESKLAVVCFGLLLSALATEYIGIHALFGAFLLGVITPHDSKIAHDLTHRLQDLVQVLFLPAFFAFTGMRTEIGLIEGTEDWLLCLSLLGIAVAGKFGGTMIAALFSGLSVRYSAALGILMNTRGLVELIVLNVGLDMGVLSPRLFTMLVIMALVTTFMTGPLLTFVLPEKARVH